MNSKNTTKDYRKKIDQLKAKRSHAIQKVKDERKELIKSDDEFSNVAEAQNILQRMAQKIQQEVHDQIAGVVTRCLSTVFGEDAYEFKIHFERKRGRTEARLTFIKDGHELSPRSGSGGGVQDIAAFASRLVSLMLSRPSPRRVVILDEPFKNVHGAQYRERVGILLETLAKEMDFQFIISTGIEDFHIGKVINLEDI